jgi:hypothetical protein
VAAANRIIPACLVSVTNPHSLHCCHSVQVNLLVLHEAFSPSTPRLIREAAALLSPQSVAMPVQQAEHVTPITSRSGADHPKALFASILQLANRGVLPMVLSAALPRCYMCAVLPSRHDPCAHYYKP